MDTNIQQLNAQLEKECPVCHNDMVLPTTVPDCGHVFCFICIKGVCRQNMGGCPICRGPIDQEIFNKPKATIDLKMNIPDSPVPAAASAAPPAKKRRTDEGNSGSNNTSDNNVVVKSEPADGEDVKPDVNALNAQMSAANVAQNVQSAAQVQQPVVAAPDRNYWLYHGRKRGWWRFDPRIEKDIEEAKSSGMPVTEVVICGSRYIIDFTQMVQYPKDAGLTHKRDVKRVTTGEFDAMNVKGVAGLFAR